MDLSNYRPILLLWFQRSLRKLRINKLLTIYSQYKILYKYQSSFRTKLLTDLCHSSLNDKSLKGLNNFLLTAIILLDLQKAFDTISHNILLEKLNSIRFCDDTVNWFNSYVIDQAFSIQQYSSFSKISCGVSQGSIVGPLFFVTYVKDRKQAKSSVLLLYADDFCLVIHHKYVTEI